MPQKNRFFGLIALVASVFIFATTNINSSPSLDPKVITSNVGGLNIDSKTKIISCGRKGNGSASFKSWKIADSQIKKKGKATVVLWSLNKIQDTAGNYLGVHYFKDELK